MCGHESIHWQARRLFEPHEDWPRAAAVLANLACLAWNQGEAAKARAAFERCLELYRELNQPVEIADCLQILGEVIIRQGGLERARDLLLECLAIRDRLGDQSGTVSAAEVLAGISFKSGDVTHAVHLAAAASAIRARTGTPIPVGRAHVYDATIAEYRSAMSDADFEAAWAFGDALPPGSPARFGRDRRIIALPAWDSTRL